MRKSFLCLVAVLAGLMSVSCSSKTESEALVKKVIFPGDYPDPSIVRDGNDFYMTHSSMVNYPGLLVWHSTDLQNWEPISRAVSDQPYSIWAPEICKIGDKFYIYYPSSTGENYVVVADNPAGPWSDPIKLDAEGIDPGHIYDNDGKLYLYTDDGWCVQLSDDGLSTVGERKKLYDGWEYPSDWDTEGMYLESPKLFKRGDYFYFVSAEGGTAGPATSHMCVVARSKSALGPWENSPYNPLVHTYSAEDEWWSKGHGTIFDDAEGNWYIVYHAYRNGYYTLGRSTIIESIVWTEDGWPKLADEENNFVEDTPDSPQYSSVRDYSNPLLWSKFEPGFEDEPLWTITAVDKSYQVTAEFELAEGAKAGLYLFYNDKANIGVQDTVAHFYVRITNDRNVATTEKSLDGENWTVVEDGVDVSSYHHNNYKSFFALRPALMISEGVTVRNFEYRAL